MEPRDYQSNANKNKPKAKAEKKITRVTQGEVIVQKKSIGKRIKGIFIAADFGSVARHVIYEVLIPAARNMVYDVTTKSIERTLYGDNAFRRRNTNIFGQPRITYNQPVSRPYSSPLSSSITQSQGPRGPAPQRSVSDNIIFATRQEAELVLERLNDVLDQYDVVSLGDLYELIGAPSSHTDQKWGWTVGFSDAPIRQVREGYIIDLPPTEAIQ